MTSFSRPFELLPLFRERVWGRESLAPFFPDRPGKEHIGEVWFTFEENSTSLGKNLGELLRDRPSLLGDGADPAHPGICPILVKLLFTTERLSVQVHPDDAYAQLHHGSLGKTEAWYVLESQGPGEVAVGFKKTLKAERLEEVATSGEIQELLDWRKVHKGDVIFTPAGTVHAIGAGVTICEIQQNSDITYRLYDYGRARELHLEHGAKVANLSPYAETATPFSLAPGRDQLVACPYFRIERISPAEAFSIPSGLPTYALAVCTSGSGTLDDQPARAGQAWFIPAQSEAVKIRAPQSEWILTYASQSALEGINLG
jgi:mannose-6-phosphate isomerase